MVVRSQVIFVKFMSLKLGILSISLHLRTFIPPQNRNCIAVSALVNRTEYSIHRIPSKYRETLKNWTYCILAIKWPSSSD